MKWVLIAIVINMPVKTDLVYNSLPDCPDAESQMRKAWSEAYSQAKKSELPAERLGEISSAMATGTCVTSK